MKQLASMPTNLARSVGDNGGKCEELYQRLSQIEWGDTNTYQRIAALISVLCDVAAVPHSPDNIEFAKSVILDLGVRAEMPRA